MAPKYKLTYFRLRALAEPIRFILAYMDEEFEDERVEFSDWPEYKQKAPFGKVPYMDIDGKILCQSTALTRYFGKQAGIAGDNEWEDFQIDMAVDTFRDFFKEFTFWLIEADKDAKARKEEVLKNKTIPLYMKRLDEHVKENGGYLANNKLSWGDLYFVSALEFATDVMKVETYSKYPNLNKLFNEVMSIPRIKSWINKRPKDVPL